MESNRRIFLSFLPAILSLTLVHRFLTARPRKSIVLQKKERVLVLGATSGIGRSIAGLYARRGAKVCVVGRRGKVVDEVVQVLNYDGSCDVLGVQGDFTEPEDMERVKDILVQQWEGVDTVVVAAGVSALQPLMSLAQSQGTRKTLEIAAAAIKGNFTGPLLAAITFIPVLEQTSPSPSILLVSSLAALIPAPTRTLYASSKSASLLLYQSLSIEHPKIAFSLFVPSTVQGSFREGAVDKDYGPLHEDDPNASGSRKGLDVVEVAKRCVDGVDRGEKVIFMPAWMRAGHWLYWIWPTFVEWRARKKYNYSIT